MAKIPFLEHQLRVSEDCYEQTKKQIKDLRELLAVQKATIRQQEIELSHRRFKEGFARFDEFDWAFLLGDGFAKTREDSQKLRDALKTCAPGQTSTGGVWNDTDQAVIRIEIYRDDPQQAKDWAAFIERILPFIKPHPDGTKRFGLSEYSIHAEFQPIGSVWQIVRRHLEPSVFLSAADLCECVRIHFGKDPFQYDSED